MIIRRMACALGLILMSVLFSIPAHAACTGSGTAWSCPSGASSSDIQAAINSASDGAVITFAAGSYSLSTWVKFSNSKGATLICATAGACTVSYSGNDVFGGDLFGGVNTHVYRISGFVFDAGGAGAPTGAIWIDNANGTQPVVMTQIRIDNNIFQDMNGGAVGIFFGHNTGQGNYYGVIDHNTFTNSTQMTPFQYIGAVIPAPPAAQLGTANNLFVEDNTIDFATMPNTSSGGCSDGWGGAAWVFRHNTSLNCLWTVHGATHGGGPANVEFYDNTVQLNSSATGESPVDCYRCFHHQGSGEFVAFNNSFTASGGKNSEVISMLNYRDYPNSIDGGAPQCTGSLLTLFADGLTDGNRLPLSVNYGYPCWHQPGRDFAGHLQPMYVWNNYWSDTGAQIPMVTPDEGGSPDYYPQHMQANRDWYNAVSASAQTTSSSPFNGTTGMGFGTLADRPTTCTTNPNESGGGVGYFATDQGPQGTLYRCSATNTWTAYYMPFTYPHPLTQTGTINLKAVAH